MSQWIDEVVDQTPEDSREYEEDAWDDVSGENLPIEDVRRSRKEEVVFMNQRRVWEYRLLGECWRTTAKSPVSMGWVDVNKGASSNKMEVSLRMVVRDFKGSDKR